MHRVKVSVHWESVAQLLGTKLVVTAIVYKPSEVTSSSPLQGASRCCPPPGPVRSQSIRSCNGQKVAWPGVLGIQEDKGYSEGLNSHPVLSILGASAAGGVLRALLGSRHTGVKTEIELEDCHSVSPRVVRTAKFSGKEVLPHKAGSSSGASLTPEQEWGGPSTDCRFEMLVV